jgi:activating signal cointegrator complex subunit 2
MLGRERRTITLIHTLLLTFLPYSQDEASVLRDRAAIEQMKADILRRAEAISDDEEDGAEVEHDLGFGDEVKVIGDGEASGGSEDDSDGDVVPPPRPKPETIMELAYIRDPELFNRDANTRRSKARGDLKAQSGESFVVLGSYFAESMSRLVR